MECYMLKLKNIKLIDGIISADYEPENSGKIGKISIDANSGRVIEMQLAETDKEFPLYVDKALDWLQEARRMGNLPQERTIMWY